MISARTALHTAPWWCRPGSASTPTTQPPVAGLAPMSWSGPRWSPPEMGLGGPVLVVFSCHPLCMPWLCSLSTSHQGCPRGGLTGTRRPGVGCVWCCDSGCAPMPQHVYLGLRGCVCVHTCVSLLTTQQYRLRRGCPQDVPRLREKPVCSSFLIWVVSPTVPAWCPQSHFSVQASHLPNYPPVSDPPLSLHPASLNS